MALEGNTHSNQGVDAMHGDIEMHSVVGGDKYEQLNLYAPKRREVMPLGTFRNPQGLLVRKRLC